MISKIPMIRSFCLVELPGGMDVDLAMFRELNIINRLLTNYHSTVVFFFSFPLSISHNCYINTT
jgi:hypothetical protein